VTKFRRFFYILFFLSVAVLLSGCNWALLNPKGVIAASEKELLVTAVLLMLTIVVPVIILTLIFAWKYRESNTKAKYSPEWTHSTAIEVVCWSIPAIIIAILGVMTWTSSHQLDPYRPLSSNIKPIPIQVVALNWKWLFIYPEQKIATVNFLQIPVNVPVRFFITADAPMNSLEIPQLAGQIYAMTGMQSQLNLMATEPGDYQGFSANFSGEGFSGMKFVVRASSEKEFKQWVNSVKNSPEALTSESYEKLALPSENNPVQTFVLGEKDLFNSVIMKYMMPMPHKMGGQ
jgi:cytochrome o ubiquinol oxidase subunit 2